ncbi:MULTISPECIES: hypothetical protein [Lysobacter]|uniref:hypothetical protein n=1 Tax=Lysobacter TaxID=68 RepID=UPI00126A0B8D|nr:MULTISPECIES: hypothetical protein [Lysobacter]
MRGAMAVLGLCCALACLSPRYRSPGMSASTLNRPGAPRSRWRWATGIAIATALAAGLWTIVFVRIGTGVYCGESPAVRWRLAIHAGECDAETGCHFVRQDDTGAAEYFGFKPIPCGRE